MSFMISIAADLLVAVLLVVTILTSIRLSRRMAAMKQDEAAMRTMIGELVMATNKADAAIAALRTTVLDSEQVLSDRLGAAARHTERLAEQVTAGEAVIERVSQIAAISRRISAETPAVPAAPVARPAAAPIVAVVPSAASAAAEEAARDERLRATIKLARDVAERSARRLDEQAA